MLAAALYGCVGRWSRWPNLLICRPDCWVMHKMTPVCLQETADPVLAAALQGRVERWGRWPILLGLALQVSWLIQYSLVCCT